MIDSLLGRSTELTALHDALSRAREGRGSLVLVRGEAGIGKTSLLASISESAQKEGVEVISGRAWELAESPPYFPLWECLRALDIERATERDPFRVWEEVLERLAAKSNDRPTAWILDDLHAADLLTLDLLTYLARPVRALPVLVVASARDKDSRISERVSQRLLRMARDGSELRLGPLPAAVVAELVERVSGKSAARSSAEIFARTEGNPLYVVECARMLRHAEPNASGVLRRLPPTVRQLVLERIEPMPKSTRDALEAGAILGRELASGRVARLLDELPARVIDALTPALDAGIVVELQPGRFAFTHILVRDAIEEAIPATRAAHLHARAEKLLATEGDGAEVLVERARHALAAMRDEAAAYALAKQAAQKSEDEGAYDRAIAIAERIDDARARGHFEPPTSDEKLHRAELLQLVGRHGDAEALCDAIADEAKNKGARELLARAALVRGADLRPAQVNASLVGLLRESLAAPPEDSRLEHLVRARLAAALQPSLDPRGPIDMARRAVADARATNDDDLIVNVLYWAGAAFVDYAPLPERIALNEELLDRAAIVGDRAMALRAQLRLTLDRIERGSLEDWQRDVELVRATSLALGHPRHRWRALLAESMWHVARGDASASERAIVELREISGLSDDPALALCLDAHIGQSARALHRDDDVHGISNELEARMATNVPRVREIGSVLRFGIAAQLEDVPAMEKLAPAALLAYPKLEVTVGDYRTDPGFFTLTVAHGMSFVGTEVDCRRIRDDIASGPKRHVAGGHVPMSYEGPVSRILGLLDARLGDHEAAERALREALEEVKRFDLGTWIAQIEYDLGRVLAGAGRDSEASSLFASAAARAEVIGMPGLVKRALARKNPMTGLTPSPARLEKASLPRFELTREGDTWLVRHADRASRVKDSRGMHLLARLVDRPGEDIHVLALGSDEPGKSLSESGAGDMIDAQARAEYKHRLGDLARDLEDARAANDVGRAERIEREKSAIEGELLGAVGLGGRSRASASASERARINVQRRLKDAIARIAEVDADAGAFLTKAVRTGTYCRFGL